MLKKTTLLANKGFPYTECFVEEMAEGVVDESGEDVEFLKTTVTVSQLPSKQFPQEAATLSKGTRLVDRWKNLLHPSFQLFSQI